MIDINVLEIELTNGLHKCLICNVHCRNRSVLGWHLREHTISTDNYIKQNCYNNIVPVCKCGCGNAVAWHKVKYRYRDFVTGHNRTGVRTAKKDYTERRVYKHKTGEYTCNICNAILTKMKSLTSHVQRCHNMSAPEYAIMYKHGGSQPLCEHVDCNNTTRYVRLSFKPFCQEHVHDAYVKSGAKGGAAPAWNKGLTKETHDGILQQSIQQSGENNPFYGKHIQSKRKS